MTSAEAAKRWGISDRRVRILCEGGLVEGVAHEGKIWRIQASAEKPLKDHLEATGHRDAFAFLEEFVASGAALSESFACSPRLDGVVRTMVYCRQSISERGEPCRLLP